MENNPSISISNPHPSGVDIIQKTGLILFSVGLLLFLIASTGTGMKYPVLLLSLSIGLSVGGAFIYFFRKYLTKSAGVKNDQIWQNSLTSRGVFAWLFGIFLTGFYIVIYWFPSVLENLIRLMDPLSNLIRGNDSDQWFLYGTLYTLAIGVMGVKALLKYRHSNYQIIRTSSIIFFQLGFAYLIPAVLQLFNQPEFYFSYFWPLKYDYLFPSTVNYLTEQPGALGVFMVFWGAAMIFVATPILTYFYGKRWYCSWVCGCGGLANTAGDPFRQLSDKSLKAWKIERWMIYSVLVFIIITTSFLWINSYYNGSVFGNVSGPFANTYGFLIGAIFSGVIGVGFYPLMGTRVWCRFGCPMAAILGIQQRLFSRFRITTNGGQCISCGNCSTYCEMGIDVKAYAQKGQNIVRASCVGCGMCATVCPRGVLNLENGPLKGRVNDNPILIGNKEAKLNL
ncbi:MAG: 4Fe-4S binding protein [Bacteroidetes bacterium]|nr:4Fe-4S binding protein [Bacteroidota bacterium]HET6243150.1 4Fe-4S dicluster domain-containing protein [Bacteroidia bacterium]